MVILVTPTIAHKEGHTMTTTPTTESISLYRCWCGCEGTVEVTFPGGFHGTTAKIKPCASAPAYVMAFEVRKSAVLEMEYVGLA